MDMILFLWALVVTALYFLEKYRHDQTRYEYLEYRTKAELNMVIEDVGLRHVKPARTLEQ